MATTHHTSFRSHTDSLDARGAVLLAVYPSVLIGTIALFTSVAALLVAVTSGLGGFVLVAAGWLAVVSASPAVARLATKRLAEMEFTRRASRSTQAVNAVVTYLVAE